MILVHKARKAFRVKLVQPELPARKAFKDQLAPKEVLGHKAFKVPKESRVHREVKVS